MGIYSLQEKDVEVTALQLTPYTLFVSGTTPPLKVFPSQSPREKELQPPTSFSGSSITNSNIDDILKEASFNGRASGSNSGEIQSFLNKVNKAEIARKSNQTVEILRSSPGFVADSYWQTKNVVKNVLIPYYKPSFSDCLFGYTNFHSVNFFTSSAVPSSSVFLYPQVTTVVSGTLSGNYIPSGPLSFDFWINPRYKNDSEASGFTAGTVLHLSSCYTVSLVSGSSKDENGLANKFRIMLQLSSSTDISPSLLNLTSLPEFAFASDDNCLEHNTWNHVTIRWGSVSRNFGSGSFVVNGETKGTFVVPSSSITPVSGSPHVLCVGNYYEGTNTGASGQSYFFTSDVATKFGLTELNSDTGWEPASYAFNHPLNAEINELKIFNKYLNDSDISYLETSGQVFPDSSLLFYLPPFFTTDAPMRTDVLVTPFIDQTSTTTTPFSKELAFEVGGHYINLENFTKDFATNTYPRLLNLTGSVIATPSPSPKSANQLLNETPGVVKRNLTVLPCDNGLFVPNYNWLSGTNSSWIDLNEIYDTSVAIPELGDMSVTSSLTKQLAGPDPQDTTTMTNTPSYVPSILQRTRDGSSNQVVHYDISNLYYGERIKPTTFTLIDSALSSSGGKVGITLKDNGFGGLYRADCAGSKASWNNVGNVFYNEGIVAIKSPHLYWHGVDGFTTEFQGVQHTFVQKIKAIAPSQQVFSSSNSNYMKVSASFSDSDPVKDFVYITNILFMDNNLNVVMKSTLAQPVVKRFDEQLGFIIQQDW